jgi:uncharacterized protein (DUF1697 family)
MERYVAFLRGVMPTNLKMADLKRCLEKAGFAEVRTLLSSGNAVFGSRVKSTAEIESKIEKAMEKELGRTFYTIVRSVDELEKVIKADPYADFSLPANAKRVVTFGRKLGKPARPLPVELDGAQILATNGREAFSAYVPGESGPVFMKLIEMTFGKEVTTRTWDTVKKCAES